MHPSLYIVGVVIMGATWLALSAFIVSYRPFSLRLHHPAGAHLLHMTWALWLLYTVSLVGMVVPIPVWLAGPLVLLVLGYVLFAVLQRNYLLAKVRRRERSDRG